MFFGNEAVDVKLLLYFKKDISLEFLEAVHSSCLEYHLPKAYIRLEGPK